MQNKTVKLQFRLTDLQYEFLKMRAEELNLDISKMILLFLNDQNILIPDFDDLYVIEHCFVPLYNNAHQLIRASRFALFKEEDKNIHERFIQIIETLEDDLKRNSSVKSMVIKKINDFISNKSMKDSNEFMNEHEKNISLNLKLILLDNLDYFDRRFVIRMTDEERRMIEIKSKNFETTMKNIMLAHAMTANVFSVSLMQYTNMSDLSEYGQLLNNIARFMNKSLKSEKEIEDIDMLSMITDLNAIDDYVRSDTEFYEDIIEHIQSKIKIKIINEGAYWTESFRRKVKEKQNGGE